MQNLKGHVALNLKRNPKWEKKANHMGVWQVSLALDLEFAFFEKTLEMKREREGGTRVTQHPRWHLVPLPFCEWELFLAIGLSPKNVRFELRDPNLV
jgi:hypothetical protein